MGLGQINSFGNSSSYNEELVFLLDRFFAYSLEEEKKAKNLIQELKVGEPLMTPEEVSNFLAKFQNDHLSLVKPTHFKAGDCVFFDEGKINIKTFWCQKKEGETPEEIRHRFGQEFLKALKLSLKEGNLIKIDLRENKGGGDDEMEFALFPFLNEGVHLYDYQFKFLTSPRKFPRIITKVSETLGFDRFLKERWDEKLPYKFHFKKEKWKPAQIEGLLQVKKRISENDYKVEVLVGPQTASASELFVGILRNHKKAKIVGGPTRGCVGAPETYPLKDLKISIPAVRVFF